VKEIALSATQFKGSRFRPLASGAVDPASRLAPSLC
jgi:hypothetical protein